METFNIRLKKAMKLRNINAATLSRKTGIKPPMISDYLANKYRPKQNNILKLANALNVEIAWLLGYSDNISSIQPKKNEDINQELYDRIMALTDDQKEIINKMIDNMK